jgi:hypothetical protein
MRHNAAAAALPAAGTPYAICLAPVAGGRVVQQGMRGHSTHVCSPLRLRFCDPAGLLCVCVCVSCVCARARAACGHIASLARVERTAVPAVASTSAAPGTVRAAIVLQTLLHVSVAADTACCSCVPSAHQEACAAPSCAQQLHCKACKPCTTGPRGSLHALHCQKPKAALQLRTGASAQQHPSTTLCVYCARAPRHSTRGGQHQTH